MLGAFSFCREIRGKMNNIVKEILNNKNVDSLTKVSLLFDVGRNSNDLEIIRKSIALCRKEIKKAMNSGDNAVSVKWHTLYRQMLLYAAPYDFDSYLLYLEMNRKPEERFYYPRRKVLLPVVRAMQQLVDDELDELVISMPPRVGKTTMLLMFVTWVLGKRPESSNLYSAYSDTITSTFYNGLLEVLTDKTTYLWGEIFPNSPVVDTNAKNETIDIARKKRYSSITCRSLYGTLNGACDCDGLLICDDLLSGIEEVLNPSRLDGAWTRVDNNLLPRTKLSAKKLWVGTRWSINDPTGRRIELLENEAAFANERIKIINLPALDENGNSNFNYMYNKGFTKEYFEGRRASFERNNDIASWLAQYMGEPIERQGTLFTVDTMRFYNGVLPDGEPDRVFGYCDCAFGGTDYTAFPIAYQYGERIYIHDCVFNNGDKKVTQPKVAAKIIENNVGAADFEYNGGGDAYAETVSDIVEKSGHHCNISGRYAYTRKKKETRIYEYSPEIREFYFLDAAHRSKEYEAMIQNLLAFTIEGKVKHDDAPDALAGLAEMARSVTVGNAVIMDRPF